MAVVDEITVEELEHGRPGVAHERCRAGQAEHECRQRHVRDEVPDRVLLAKGLDATAREDVEPDREDVDGRETQHERGRAAHQHRRPGERVVGLGVLA